MCAVPAPEGASTPPRRTRITPVQWLALAAVLLLLLEQMGFFRLGSTGSLLQQGTRILPALIAIVLAVTVHEFSHALVATSFGDDLPRRSGRLTLNPLAHLDPLGSLLFLIAQFGWGKPVPINPNAMRNPGLGWALSSVAGPASNFLSAAAAVVVLALLGNLGPVDGSVGAFIQQFIVINLALGVFNLVPLPPLDGFGFVYGLSPGPVRVALRPIQQYGPLILLALIFLPRLVPGFPPILSTLIEGGIDLLTNLLGALYRVF